MKTSDPYILMPDGKIYQNNTQVNDEKILKTIQDIEFYHDIKEIDDDRFILIFDKLKGLKTLNIPEHVRTLNPSIIYSLKKDCTVTLPVDLMDNEFKDMVGINIHCNNALYKALTKLDDEAIKQALNDEGFITRKRFKVYIDALHRVLNSEEFDKYVESPTPETYKTFIDATCKSSLIDKKNTIVAKLLEKVPIYDSLRCLYYKTRIFKEEILCIPGKIAIDNVYRFSNVTIPSNVKELTFDTQSLGTIDYQAFIKSAIETVTIPKSVEAVNHEAFKDCRALKTLIFEKPSSLTTIGESVFENCTNLESVTIPDRVKDIQKNAFHGCNNLKEITMPLTFMGKSNNYWSSLGIDTTKTTIVFDDPIYQAIHAKQDTKHLASLCAKEIYSPDQLNEYVRSLLNTNDTEYRNSVLLLLLENIPKDNRVRYYKDLLKSSAVTDEMIVSIHQVSKHMIDSDSGLSKVFDDYLVTRFKQGSIKNIIQLYDKNTLNDFTTHDVGLDINYDLHKNFKNLYIDKQCNLHVLLPFARGLNGIITDNTCKATLELQEATNNPVNNPNCLTEELNSCRERLLKLSKILPKDSPVMSNIHSLVRQIDAHRNGYLLNYLTGEFNSKLRSLYQFPRELKSFLGKESNNLYSIVLSPPLDDQDPYLRSVDTAVCSFARGKSLKNGMDIVKTTGNDSLFSMQLTSRLTELIPSKQITIKDRIKKEAIEAIETKSLYASLAPDKRLVEAENKFAAASNDNKLLKLNGYKTEFAKQMPNISNLMTILNACGAGGNLRKFLPAPRDTDEDKITENLQKLHTIIDNKIRQINASIKSNDDINQIAVKQMQVITATKYSYMQHMHVSEEEANERFEKIFTNEAHIDLTDVDGILNTLLLPEELDPYQPFYTPINDLESEHIIGKSIAEDLDIVAQFFIGKLNVYCVEQGLTDRKNNFGKLLDSSENYDLRDNLINVICSCFHQGTSVELGIIGYLNEHKNAFGLNKPLQKTDIDTILQSFTEQYCIIKDFREKDEFYLYEESQSPTVVKYGANVCFSMSELFDPSFNKYTHVSINNDLYQKRLAKAFKELCNDTDNNSLKDQTLNDVLRLSPADLIELNLLSSKPSDNIWTVVRNLASLSPECRDGCFLYKEIQKCVQNMKINQYINFLRLVGDPHTMRYSLDNFSDIFPNMYHTNKKKMPSPVYKPKTMSVLKEIQVLNVAQRGKDKDDLKWYMSRRKNFKHRDEDILWILKNDENVIDSYNEIFYALTNTTRRDDFNKLPNIAQWAFKQTLYYFPGSSKRLVILQTMRENTPDGKLRAEIDTFIKRKYGIDTPKKKDNNSPKPNIKRNK